jgi:hypothetical protein
VAALLAAAILLGDLAVATPARPSAIACAAALERARIAEAKELPALSRARVSVESAEGGKGWRVTLSVRPRDLLERGVLVDFDVTISSDKAAPDDAWHLAFVCCHDEIQAWERHAAGRVARLSWPNAPGYVDMLPRLARWRAAGDACLAAAAPR